MAELGKLLESQTLHGSESLKSFLRFVVTKTVENQDTQLKEYTIATEVFGRNSKYDSRNDSVVRVQASRLRSKLQEYYANEGKDDAVIIELPKGGYIPVFTTAKPITLEPIVEDAQERTLPPEPASHIDNSKPAEIISQGKFGKPSRWVYLALIGISLLALWFAFTTFYYRSEVTQLSDPALSRADDMVEMKAAAPLWSDFLYSTQPILVSFSNTRFTGTAETGMRLLNPFTTDSKDGEKPTSPDNQIITEHYTGIGEVMGVYALADFFSKARHSFRVKRSLLMTWDDLKAGNLVILGSPAENNLLRDLPQQQDFVFGVLRDEQGNASYGITNLKPKAGEQKYYVAKQEGLSRSQISEDYAVISYLKGLDSKNRLMILAGITTYGTQAAAEYVSNPEYIKELIARLNTSGDSNNPKLPAYYQVLIKVKVNGGVPVQLTYVTHHTL
ncbi:MAG: hypothetical protein AB1757_00005 [Acidobacteriota bacterium]